MFNLYTFTFWTCLVLGVKCIESEDEKNEHDYTFGYRSNCHTLLKILYFYKIIQMFPLQGLFCIRSPYHFLLKYLRGKP